MILSAHEHAIQIIWQVSFENDMTIRIYEGEAKICDQNFRDEARFELFLVTVYKNFYAIFYAYRILISR